MHEISNPISLREQQKKKEKKKKKKKRKQYFKYFKYRLPKYLPSLLSVKEVILG